MVVVVVGLSHRTVPLELLERMTVPSAALPKALDDLTKREHVTEAVVLSTCHRTEVYVATERFHGAVQDARNFLSELGFEPPEELSDRLYTYYDEVAATHLFGVAAGVDSVMVGESEVLGQVRDAWERARQQGAAGPTLSVLFRHAIEVGKRARSETTIARRTASLAYAAVAMAARRMGPSVTLAGTRVLIVGAGDVGERMADALASMGIEQLVVANRSAERAAALAERVRGTAVPFGALADAMADADVVLTSTGSSAVVIERADVERAMRLRPHRQLLVIDVAVPRDVDPGVSDVPGVVLLDMADLTAFVEANLDERRKEVERVRDIIAEEVHRYLARTTAREVVPTITSLRDRAEAVRVAELERFRNRLESLPPEAREALEALTKGIVAKLLHEPTVRLKDAAGTASGQRLSESLRQLFDL